MLYGYQPVRSQGSSSRYFLLGKGPRVDPGHAGGTTSPNRLENFLGYPRREENNGLVGPVLNDTAIRAKIFKFYTNTGHILQYLLVVVCDSFEQMRQKKLNSAGSTEKASLPAGAAIMT